MHVSSAATLLALAASVVLLVTPARAEVRHGRVETDRRGDVFGAQMVVQASPSSSVVFDLLTPRGNDGRRHLWGRCRLSYIGWAEYRCEFDVSQASRRLREGTWLVRVRTGSRMIAERSGTIQ